MIAFLLLLALLGLSGATLTWGLAERSRVFQYPTLAAAAWLGFIIPQAIGTLSHPANIPTEAFADHGLEMALFMSCICVLAGFLGYEHTTLLPRKVSPWRRSDKVLRASVSNQACKGDPRDPQQFAPSVHRRGTGPGRYSYDRLAVLGCVFLFLGLVGFHKLAMLSGGYVRHFSVEGNYLLYWAGLPVAYNFFANLVYPALLLLLLSTLKKPTTVKWLMVGMACLVPLATIAFLGRRGPLVEFVLIWAIALYFVRSWSPNRTKVLLALVLGAGAMYLAVPYRTHSQIGADRSKISEIDLVAIVSRPWRGSDYVEFHYSVVALPAIQSSGDYCWGLMFYNTFVRDWIPHLAVGKEFKQSLLLPIRNTSDIIIAKYHWETPLGTYRTGVVSAFAEFWYFGALVFYFVGRAFRWLWDKAATERNPVAQIAYVLAAPSAMTTIVNRVNDLPSTIFFISLISLAVHLFCDKEHGNRSQTRGKRVSLKPHAER